MKFQTWSLLASGLLLILGCSQESRVQTEFNPTVDFASYKTFSFAEPSFQTDDGPEPMPEAIRGTITAAVSDELKARGMEAVESGGDLSIACSAAVAEETNNDQWGYTYDEAAGGHIGQTFSFREGTLLIDIFETTHDQLVWRGWTHGAVGDIKTPDLSELDEIVRGMFVDYPPDANAQVD